MKIVSRAVLAVLLIVAVAPWARASCVTDLSLDPNAYEEILYDTKFNGNCADWAKSGSATRIQVGSNWLVEFNGTGTLLQANLAGTYTNGMYMAFVVYVVAGTPGTEVLKAQIVQGSTVVEELETYTPSDTTETFNEEIGNYSDEVFSVRFKFEPGASPGTTKFRVDSVQVWGYF